MSQFTATKPKLPEKPQKPHEDFPLFPHASGRWAKKIRGKLHYFGKWDNPEAALNKYLEQKDDLLAGRSPRSNRDGLTVRDLVNAFLTTKEGLVESGEVTPRTFYDYKNSCARLIDAFGRTRLVTDLQPSDFEQLKSKLAKTRGPVSLSNEIQRVRTVFKYGYEEGKLDKPVLFGQSFRKPTRKTMRRLRSKQELDRGLRMFAQDELRSIIDAAGPQLKAMVMLGINCGLGASDLSAMPKSAIDLKARWLDYPRIKTGVPRRVPLWKETVEAIEAALKTRPKAFDKPADYLMFVTRFGRPWLEVKPNGRPHDAIGAEFRKLLTSLGIKRHGVNFYALRHGTQTIGEETRDFVAVSAIMGHVAADGDMSAAYREAISDERLQAVTDHIHKWLWPAKKTKRARKSVAAK